MKKSLYFTTIDNVFTSTKFDKLVYSEDGINLNYKKKHIKQISYAEIEHIYIKKYRLHPIVELTGMAAPFIFIFFIAQNFASDLIMFCSILIVPIILNKIINYKWYRLEVLLKDGTFFSKKIANYKKVENVTLLQKICGKILYYNSARLATA